MSDTSPRISERLVERFIDFSGWPTARKMTLAMPIALAFHFVVGPTALLGVSYAHHLIDVRPLMHLGFFWTLSLVPLLIVSIVLTRRGREGRWTAYLFVVLYGACCFRLVTMLGTASTPLHTILLSFMHPPPSSMQPRELIA